MADSRHINVLVIDDSAFMRKSLSKMLESDPEITVVGTARDGRDGIEKIRELKPDLVTLDIEMPVMDGLTALGIIMKEMPLPVLMVSSLTTDGAKATLDALNLGAVDFIPKELSHVSLNIVQIREELIAKVKQISGNRFLRGRLERIRKPLTGPSAFPATDSGISGIDRRKLRAVIIGISTGGPFALMHMLPKLPREFPLGIAVVQHMPPHFTKSMAERLDSISNLEIKEAEEGDLLSPGRVLIAPGGRHLTFAANGRGIVANVSDQPAGTLYRPSADITMASAAAVAKAPILGVIMTGMGKDGLEGLRKIKQYGGYIVAQDESSCVVYGMPKAAVEAGVADISVSLEDMPEALKKLTGA